MYMSLMEVPEEIQADKGFIEGLFARNMMGAELVQTKHQ